MTELSRLRWLCRRGMRELDVVLMRYLQDQYSGADASRQRAFRQLLAMQDPDLYALIAGRAHSEDPLVNGLLQAMLSQK